MSTDLRIAYALVTASTTVLMAMILPWWGAAAWLAVWAGVGYGYHRAANHLLGGRT